MPSYKTSDRKPCEGPLSASLLWANAYTLSSVNLKDNLFSLLLLQGTNVINSMDYVFTKHRKRCQLLTRQNSWGSGYLLKWMKERVRRKHASKYFYKSWEVAVITELWHYLAGFMEEIVLNLRLGGWISLEQVEESGLSKWVEWQ